MDRISRDQWIPVILYFCLAVYCAVRLRAGFSAGLTHDDLMNTYRAWAASWSDLFFDNILYFRLPEAQRPSAALILRKWFEIWHFDLFPLRTICIFLLCCNAFLITRITHKISHSIWAGILAGFLYAYHWHWFALYLSSGFIYDILCSFFCLSAFLAYLNPGKKYKIAAFLLYICALNSKEIAVALPPALFLFEALKKDQKFPTIQLIWPVFYGILTIPYILFRVMSAQGLGGIEGYALQPGIGLYLSQAGRYFRQWTQTEFILPGVFALCIPLGILGAGWLLKEFRIANWGIWSFLIGVLPVALIHPRNLDSVYVPLSFLTISVATVVMKAGRNRPFPSAGILFACLLVLIYIHRHALPSTPYRLEDNHIRTVLTATERLNEAVPRESILLIEQDAFGEQLWSSYFLFAMTRNVKETPVYLINKLPEPQHEQLRKKADYILNWKETEWEVIPPHSANATDLEIP